MRFMLFISAFILFLGCAQLNPTDEKSIPISHEIFDQLLKKYVDEKGLVDYSGLLLEKEELGKYLNLISGNAPNDDTWSKEAQLAYWINAYNAFTISLILDHYPLESIKDIGSSIQVPFINTPWDIKFLKIAGEEYDLNNIEHNILRKKWEEPRIHFAINCASLSCPKLRAEAYTEEKLETQLAEQAVAFINDDFRNEINQEKVEISKIFKWFSGDFKKKTDLIGFLNQYSNIQISSDAEIDYKDYRWALNDSKQ
ncbi:MAG: DUF547 domain-containing protein [Cyclobacteriaceae bacterium]